MENVSQLEAKFADEANILSTTVAQNVILLAKLVVTALQTVAFRVFRQRCCRVVVAFLTALMAIMSIRMVARLVYILAKSVFHVKTAANVVPHCYCRVVNAEQLVPMDITMNMVRVPSVSLAA